MRKHFSICLFIFIQVIIDCETLYFILREEFPLHRTLHTYLGSNIAVLIAVIAGRPICNALIKLWNRMAPALKVSPEITLRSAIITSMIGAYSHVLLDSVMHQDIHPLQPFSEANPLLRVISLPLLHQLCVLSAMSGIGILMILGFLQWGKNRKKRV